MTGREDAIKAAAAGAGQVFARIRAGINDANAAGGPAGIARHLCPDGSDKERAGLEAHYQQQAAVPRSA